jgi:hypothetical protein
MAGNREMGLYVGRASLIFFLLPLSAVPKRDKKRLLAALKSPRRTGFSGVPLTTCKLAVVRGKIKDFELLEFREKLGGNLSIYIALSLCHRCSFDLKT